MKDHQFVFWLLVLIAVVGSGVQVAYSANETRRLHAQLEAVQAEQDAELAAYSRLLIERSALAAYQNVERLAQTELDMHFPASVERVAP